MILPPRHMAPGEHMTAALYNALIDFCRRSTPIAGSNVSVDYTAAGTRINARAGGDVNSSVDPWTVRYHVVSVDGTESGQWEVYVPDAAMSVGETCRCLNRKANLTTGHSADEDGWKILYLSESDGSTRTVSGKTYRQWTIKAHGKRRAMIASVDGNDDAVQSGVYVAAHRLRGDNESSFTDEVNNRYSWGDTFAQSVADVKVDADGVRTVSQLFADKVSVAAAENRPFDLVWWFSLANSGDLTVSRVDCVRLQSSLAGTDTTFAAEKTDVKDAGRVYLHIVTQNGANNGEIVSDPSSVAASDSQTFVLLYVLDGHNTVTSDTRISNLSNIQYYR